MHELIVIVMVIKSHKILLKAIHEFSSTAKRFRRLA
jgi:hypothetical protein